MKKLISVVICISIVLSLTACGSKTIGTIKGAEWDFIEIDGVEYAKVTDSDIHQSDKDKYLGKVSDGGKITFKCYSVKDDDDARYIYCLWDWEGSIYERTLE